MLSDCFARNGEAIIIYYFPQTKIFTLNWNNFLPNKFHFRTTFIYLLFSISQSYEYSP